MLINIQDIINQKMAEVPQNKNIIHDITDTLVTEKNVIRFPDYFFPKKQLKEELANQNKLLLEAGEDLQYQGEIKLQKLVVPVNFSLTINNIKSIDIQNMNAQVNTVITLGVYYGWLGDSEQYRRTVDLLREKITLQLSNDENIRLTINNNFVEVVEKRNQKMLVFTVRKNIDAILAEKVFFTPIEKLHLLFSIKIQSIYEPQIQQYIEQVYSKIQKDHKQLEQSQNYNYKSKMKYIKQSLQTKQQILQYLHRLKQKQLQKQQNNEHYHYHDHEHQCQHQNQDEHKHQCKHQNQHKHKHEKQKQKQSTIKCRQLLRQIIKLQKQLNQIQVQNDNETFFKLKQKLKQKLRQKFKVERQQNLEKIAQTKQNQENSYDKLKTLIIKFNLMNFTKNKQLNQNNTAPQIFFGDQLNIGEYQIDTKKSITQVSMKSYPQNIITTLKLHYLYSMIDSSKKQKQSTRIDKEMLPILEDKKNKLRVHNYVHTSITLFRHPIVTFLTVILPLIFISFVNLASFGIHTGKDGENIKRLLVLVTSIVAYIGLIPVLRSKIPPSDKPTLIQILVFAQLIPSLAALVEVIKYREESAPKYTIQFKIGIAMTAMIVIFSICAMLAYMLVFYHRFRQSYKTVNPAEEKYVCDQKLWQNSDFRTLLKFMQFYEDKSRTAKQKLQNSVQSSNVLAEGSQEHLTLPNRLVCTRSQSMNS